MVTHRVFVIWTHPLFHKSLQLLLNHPNVEWVGETNDYSTARDLVTSLQPDTVLVEEVDDISPTAVMEILETCAENVRVIRLSLTDNQLSVYHREQKTIVQEDDLLHLIQGRLL